ncbi:MAG: VOC family protein [Gammaproteobacteria bacterium]|nr:VOC family protein [Gammaproteobacteria bacterium]MDD9894232.1 VOC family protein [Gammaproteobacteria bacterium]MDD9957433.1 VOC family protein [Gammaproteobacteria bacterium]
MTQAPNPATLLGQDHVVLVVADIESAIANWRDQFGLPLQYEVTHEEQGISQAFFPLADGTFMELIAPTSSESRVAEILREKGEGIHVLAMQVDDLDSSVNSLQEKGVELIGAGTDRVFIHPDSANGVMIQLWPKDRPHRWRDGNNA